MESSDALLTAQKLNRERARLRWRAVERRKRRYVHLALSKRARARELAHHAILKECQGAQLLGKAVGVAEERADKLQLLLEPHGRAAPRAAAAVLINLPLASHRRLRAARPQHRDAARGRRQRLLGLEAADYHLVLILGSALGDHLCDGTHGPCHDAMVGHLARLIGTEPEGRKSLLVLV